MSADQVQRLVDIEEIARLKARYCRCVDTKDWAGYGALVTDDFRAVTDSGVHDGRDAVVSYLSGALGNIPGKSEPVSGGIEAEARQTMENIGAVLAENGLSFDDVFKCTIMLADMSNWAEFNSVYVRYFKPGRMPARSAFGASGLALGALVEVECCAYVPRK